MAACCSGVIENIKEVIQKKNVGCSLHNLSRTFIREKVFS